MKGVMVGLWTLVTLLPSIFSGSETRDSDPDAPCGQSGNAAGKSAAVENAQSAERRRRDFIFRIMAVMGVEGQCWKWLRARASCARA